jgi:hypothetical protein
MKYKPKRIFKSTTAVVCKTSCSWLMDGFTTFVLGNLIEPEIDVQDS